MEFAIVLAATAALASAIWLQRSTAMARGYAWLSRIVAAVFGLLVAPTLARNFDLATLSQAIVLVSLPLIAVPYQVRMMAMITRSKSPRPAAGERARGPGGGRVRNRRPRRR